MEIHLKGIGPKNKMGEDIHYDVWSWRPLWNIIVNNSDNLDEQDRIVGQTKNHSEFKGEKHSAVIASLLRLLKNRSHGEVDRALYQSPYLIVNGQKAIVDELKENPELYYRFSWDSAVDLLRFCKSNKGFEIES